MGSERHNCAVQGSDALPASPANSPPQLLPAPPQRCISRAALQSFVLSGAADPPLAQQARVMAFGLVCAVIGGIKLARHLSCLQLSCVIILPSIVLAAFLMLLCTQPEAYRRRRLRLWAHPLLQFVTLVAVSVFRSAADAALPNKATHAAGGALGALTFLVHLLLLSGMTSAMAVFPVYQIPPVSMAATAAAWTAALSATNDRVCGAQLLQHPQDAQHMAAWYRLLVPLVAPLEPLLLAAGIGANHPERRCHGVLAALQFWVVALALPLVVARGQVSGYMAWRAQQRRMDQQRRREEREAWGFGFAEPSSSSEDCSKGSNEGSSGMHSPVSPPAALREAYSQLLRPHTLPPNDIGPAAASLGARRPGQSRVRLQQGQPVRRHHPADWQYVRALRVLRALRPTPSRLAVLALFALALSAWHCTTFP